MKLSALIYTSLSSKLTEIQRFQVEISKNLILRKSHGKNWFPKSRYFEIFITLKDHVSVGFENRSLGEVSS